MSKRLATIAVLALLASACTTSLENEEPSVSTTARADPPNGEARARTNATVPDRLRSMENSWETDFTRSVIDLNELQVGIPASDPRDAIPPIDNPQFEPVAETTWLSEREPGVLLEIEGDARFYPLSVLTRHEIVNDVLGEVPVAVTYCPLCNTAVTFDRRFEGEVLRLGVSGLLRNSDLVMWDDVSESLWQQITGEAIVGDHSGKRLTLIPAGIVRWLDFKEAHPNGLAMSDNQGFGRVYGTNPYEYYSSRSQPYGFFQGEIDDSYPALERVVGVTVGESSKAYPFSALKDLGVVNDIVEDRHVVIFWGAGETADALDSGSIAEGSGIGTALAFSSLVDGRALTFESVSDTEFRDIETGSNWSILGLATSGELRGSQLELVPHSNEFWFAWQAFFPDGEVWSG